MSGSAHIFPPLPGAMPEEQAAALYLRTVLLLRYMRVAERFLREEEEFTPAALTYHAKALRDMDVVMPQWQKLCAPLGWSEPAEISEHIRKAVEAIEPGVAISGEIGQITPAQLNLPSAQREEAARACLGKLQQAQRQTGLMLDAMKHYMPELEGWLREPATFSIPPLVAANKHPFAEDTESGRLQITLRKVQQADENAVKSCVRDGYAAVLRFLHDVVCKPSVEQESESHQLGMTLDTMKHSVPRTLEPRVQELCKLMIELFPLPAEFLTLQWQAREDLDARDVPHFRRDTFPARPDDSATVRYLRGAVVAEKTMGG